MPPSPVGSGRTDEGRTSQRPAPVAPYLVLMPLHLHDGDASLTLTSTAVRATTAWCQAAIPLGLGPDELPRLAASLRRLSEDGYGSYLWTNDGGEVRIEVVMAKRGETHWSVRLQAAPDFLHELRLVFVGLQEELVALANGFSP